MKHLKQIRIMIIAVGFLVAGIFHLREEISYQKSGLLLETGAFSFAALTEKSEKTSNGKAVPQMEADASGTGNASDINDNRCTCAEAANENPESGSSTVSSSGLSAALIPSSEAMLSDQKGNEGDLAETSGVQAAEPAATAPSGEPLVNINTAGDEELMTLPGIGEAKAAAILRYREDYGDFLSIEEIMNVSGIKEAAFSKIREYITV